MPGTAKSHIALALASSPAPQTAATVRPHAEEAAAQVQRTTVDHRRQQHSVGGLGDCLGEHLGATALIDRLLRGSHVLVIRGPSYRDWVHKQDAVDTRSNAKLMPETATSAPKPQPRQFLVVLVGAASDDFLDRVQHA